MTLDFDHIHGEKIKCVPQMPLKKIKEEASKCELRCRICHSIKSHSENYNNTGQNVVQNNDPRNVSNRELRKKRRFYVDNIKRMVGACQMCGYEYDGKPYVFDFDHIQKEDKVKNISWHIGHGSAIEKINKELARCVLLCRNCHAIRTSKQFNWHIVNYINE